MSFGRRFRFRAVAGALPLLAVNMVLTAGPVGQIGVPPVPSVGWRIGVVPVGAAGEPAGLADGLFRELASRVGLLSNVTLVAEPAIVRIGAGHPLTVISELNLDAALEAHLGRIPAGYRLSMRLWKRAVKVPAWEQTHVGPAASLQHAVAEMAIATVTTLELQIDAALRERLQRLATRNDEAYEAYLRATTTARQTSAPKRLERARDGLREAVGLDPGFARAWAALSEIETRLAASTGLQGSSYVSLEAARKAIELDPGEPEGHRSLGLAWLAKDNQVNALKSFRRALELNPSDPASVRQVALIPGHLGDFAASLPWAWRDTLINPTSATKHGYLGFLYVDMGDDERAEPWLRRAAQLDPDDELTEVARVIQHLVNHRVEEARTVGSKRVARSPDSPEGYVYQGLAEQVRGNDREAVKFYAEALKRGRRDWDLRAFLMLQEGRRDEALHLVRRIRMESIQDIELGSDRMGPRLNLGYGYVIEGDLQGACRWLQEAIDVGWRYFRWARMDPGWARLRDSTCFQRMIDEVEREIEAQCKAAPTLTPG